MALSDEQIVLTARQIGGLFDDLAVHYQSDDIVRFARAIEAEARRDALEEAAQLVEKATYRTRWVKAGVNGQASNTPPCALAAAIRKLKEDTQ